MPSSEVSAVSAVKQCPFILITAEDYALRDARLSDDAITGLRQEGTVITVDDALSAPYRNTVLLNGSTPDDFGIAVAHRIIYVTATQGEILLHLYVSGRRQRSQVLQQLPLCAGKRK